MPAAAGTIFQRFGWTRVEMRADAVPAGEAMHSALKLQSKSMHGVSRPQLFLAMWMHLRQFCLSGCLHTTTRRAGEAGMTQLTPAGVGATGAQVEAEQGAACDAAVHVFFQEAGFSGGVSGLSAHQHSVLHASGRKSKAARGGTKPSAGGAYTQIGQDSTIRGLRRKTQDAGVRLNGMRRDYEAVQEHVDRQAAQLRAAGLRVRPAPRPRVFKRQRDAEGGGGGGGGSGDNGYTRRKKRHKPKAKCNNNKKKFNKKQQQQ